MRTKVLSSAQLSRLRRHPGAYRALRKVRFALGRVLPPADFPDGPGRLHRNDFMTAGTDRESLREYAAAGRSTVDILERCAAAAGLTDLESKRWLEVGCGYGRIVRFLVERVPPESVWVTDVIDEGVRFCAKEFGVNAIRDLDASDAAPPGGFHVIYLISVLTHLPNDAAASLIGRLSDLLADGGVLVVTAHGPDLLDDPGRYGVEFGAHAAALAQEMAASGFCYRPYGHSTDGGYGIAWHSQDGMREVMTVASGGRLTPVHFEHRALQTGLQDVYAFKRPG